jgi:hypothetical protein
MFRKAVFPNRPLLRSLWRASNVTCSDLKPFLSSNKELFSQPCNQGIAAYSNGYVVIRAEFKLAV